jgi:hypothetical protein
LFALSIDQNSGLSHRMILKAMTRASRNQEVLLLYGHVPSKSETMNPYSFDIEFLEFILKESQYRNFEFFTVSRLIGN